MERTWKPIAAGILCIIAGVIGLISGTTIVVIGSIAGVHIVVPWIGLISGMTIAVIYSIAGVGTAVPWIGAVGIPFIVLGTISIVGGVHAVRRRSWGFALAGSICAPVAGHLVLGILAIVFVAMGKDEFE